MLQQHTPDDFVIATGIQDMVRELIRQAATRLGIILEFSALGTEEIGTVLQADPAIAPALKPGAIVVRVDPRYFGPTEVDSQLGDASKAIETPFRFDRSNETPVATSRSVGVHNLALSSSDTLT